MDEIIESICNVFWEHINPKSTRYKEITRNLLTQEENFISTLTVEQNQMLDELREADNQRRSIEIMELIILTFKLTYDLYH